MEPTAAGEQLVGKGVMAEEVDQTLELSWIFRPDVGSLTDKVLRVAHTANHAIHSLVSEARIDDNRAYFASGGLQQQMAAVGQIRHDLHRGNILRVLPQLQKLAQLKMLRQSNVIKIIFHGVTCS